MAIIREFKSLKTENEELNEENKTLYAELSKARAESEARAEEIQNEVFSIIGNMKLLKDNKEENWIELLGKYIDEQYEILKKDLFEDYQSNEQINE